MDNGIFYYPTFECYSNIPLGIFPCHLLAQYMKTSGVRTVLLYYFVLSHVIIIFTSLFKETPDYIARSENKYCQRFKKRFGECIFLHIGVGKGELLF